MNKILFFTLILILSSLKITAQYSITHGGTIAEIFTPATGVTAVTGLGDENPATGNESTKESIALDEQNTILLQLREQLQWLPMTLLLVGI